MALLGKKSDVYVHVTPNGQEYLDDNSSHIGVASMGACQAIKTKFSRFEEWRACRYDESLRLHYVGVNPDLVAFCYPYRYPKWWKLLKGFVT